MRSFSKYNAIKTIIDGITFDSKKESKRYGELKLLKLAGIITGIELQPRFDFNISYTANGKEIKRKAFYKADFKVIYPNGKIEIEDVKGFKTATYKRKKKIIEFLFDIKILEK